MLMAERSSSASWRRGLFTASPACLSRVQLCRSVDAGLEAPRPRLPAAASVGYGHGGRAAHPKLPMGAPGKTSRANTSVTTVS